MDLEEGLATLAALAHGTRLQAFRLLVRHEPDGLSTGELVEATSLTQRAFSTHLAVLAKTGLVGAGKPGHHMIQRASMERLRDLMLSLDKDCCQGRAELCAPLVAELSCC